MKLKFLITATFAFAMMFAGNSVNAQELYKTSSIQVSDVASSVSSTPLYYTQTLRRGVRNSNVLALQKKLKEMGYYTKSLDADYGSGTHAAVKAYQRAKGLVADGIAGPHTYASILSFTGAVNPTLPPMYVGGEKPSLASGARPTLPPVVDGVKPTSNKKQCLRVSAERNTNTQLSEDDNNRSISEFTIKNVCKKGLMIDDIKFNVASSFAQPQFTNIKVRLDGDIIDSSDEIYVYYNSSAMGNELSFSAHPNFDGGYGLLEAGDDWEIQTYADIEGINGFTGTNRTTAFAVVLSDISYEYEPGSDDMIYTDDVWDQLMVVSY